MQHDIVDERGVLAPTEMQGIHAEEKQGIYVFFFDEENDPPRLNAISNIQIVETRAHLKSSHHSITRVSS